MSNDFSPSTEASALAHQLLTPVTATGNYAAALLALLSAETLTPEKAREGLERILRETERAKRSAQAIKRLFRAEHPDFSTASPLVLAREAADASPARLIASPRLSAVRCDAGLIHEALVNLLANAEAARRSSGLEGAVTLELRPAGDAVLFRVTNPATRPEDAQRIMMTPGRTTSPSGTGLGLLLVRRILAAHASELVISTDVGAVSAAFKLPVA